MHFRGNQRREPGGLRWRVPLALATGALTLCLPAQRPANSPVSASVAPARRVLASFVASRALEGRWVGEPYATFKEVRAGRPASHPEVLPLFRWIRDRAERYPTPDNLGDLALIKLVSAQPAAAAALLQQAVAGKPGDVALLTDLAAALLAAAQDDPRLLVQALGWAEQAVQLAPSSLEALFNRALALEKLQLQIQARVAWQDYLRLDAGSPWAAEIRGRIAGLSGRSRPSAAKAALAQLRSAALAGNQERVDRLVLEFPQECRLEAEGHLLPAWARSLAKGDAATAQGHLAVARSISAAQGRNRGDGLLADSLAAVDRALVVPRRRQRLLAGELAYEAAQASYDRGDYRAARNGFGRAMAKLHAAGNPLALWAGLNIALCDYQMPDYRRATSRLDALADGLPDRYLALRGRILWIKGLIELVQGSFAESLREYSTSLAAFAALRESENLGAVHILLAENLYLLGQPARAWRHTLKALALESGAGGIRLQNALQVAATAALQDGEPAAAGRFQAEAIQVALDLGDPHLIAEAYLRRIPLDAQRSNRTSLDADLSAVTRFSAAIPDVALRQRLWADALSAASAALLPGNPRQAIRDLTTALAFYSARGFTLPRTDLLLARARGYLQLGEAGLAEQDVAASLHELGTRAARIDPSQRLQLAARSLPSLRELTRLEWQLHHDPWTALVYAEQSRNGSLAEHSRQGLEGIIHQLPENVAVIELAAFADRLLTWSLTREGLSWSDQQVGAVRFAELLARFAASRANHQVDAARASLADLYDLVVRPLPREVRDKPLLVFIPDEMLHGVPFNALISRTSGRYLVQDQGVMEAPGIFALQSSPGLQARRFERLLVAADPAFDRGIFPELSPLPASRDEALAIKSLYNSSTVLLGQAATPSNVLASLSSCDIAHFGAHSVEIAAAPFLLLAPSGGPARRDAGTLSAGDIMKNDLHRLNLVVLASCGKPREAGGGWSLGQAFLAAGAARVVDSLWQIDDREAADFFIQFHRLIRRGVDPVEALRLTQVRRLDGGRQTQFDWAAFRLSSILIPHFSKGG
jgi:CHAT domain-containing protein